MTVRATPDGVVVPMPGEQGRPVARLCFDNGLEHVNLRADADMTDLMEATFTGFRPDVWAYGRNVHVEYPRRLPLPRRSRRAAVRINANVPWALDVHGGAAHLDADLTGAAVRSVAIHSGAAHVRLVLGRPDAPRTVRLASVRDLVIERPAGVPVRLEIAGGATKIALDDRRFGAVGGGLADWTPGARTAPPYSVVIAGGAAGVTVKESTR
ncbi:hypothetical protein [Thermomonospora cellulosilytica]|uniref:Uncharacterized protein n=1 Tax=Thermomonospora cellulosilytica TaxID=1411118 RepID=A0A7W3MTN4_9ACTN|nr:hypothetical protein [Thermomonospora cellulosilytica]MBA9001653.1 hypothetical protein [Thermomonospora cellulosilytica]